MTSIGLREVARNMRMDLPNGPARFLSLGRYPWSEARSSAGLHERGTMLQRRRDL